MVALRGALGVLCLQPSCAAARSRFPWLFLPLWSKLAQTFSFVTEWPLSLSRLTAWRWLASLPCAFHDSLCCADDNFFIVFAFSYLLLVYLQV